MTTYIYSYEFVPSAISLELVTDKQRYVTNTMECAITRAMKLAIEKKAVPETIKIKIVNMGSVNSIQSVTSELQLLFDSEEDEII